MKKITNYLMALIAMTLFAACSSDKSDTPDKPVAPTEQIKINGSTDLIFDHHAGSKEITFTVGSKWTAIASQPWITVTPTSGIAGDRNITIATDENTGRDSRTGIVTITSGGIEKKIDITQTAKDALVVAKNSYQVDNKGGKIEITVGHNVDFKTAINVEWIKQVQTKAYTEEKLMFEVVKNDSYDNREGKIEFTSADGKIKQEVIVYQSEGKAMIVSPTDKTFDSNAHDFEIEVKANVEFEVINPDVDWLHKIDTRALTTHTLKFQIDANEGHDAREAEIKIKNKATGDIESVSITQAQKDAIVIAKHSYQVDENGREIIIVVGHNVDFDINIEKDWVKLLSTRNYENENLVFYVQKNETGENRQCKITFTSKDKINYFSKPVKQIGRASCRERV